MKKNILYFSILILLAVAVYFLFFTEGKSAFDKSEVNFKVKDTSSIQKIFLTDLQNNNIKLERTPDGWTLNDSLVPRPDAIEGLMSVLATQDAEQVVPASFHDNVIKDLSVNNIKIEIYNKDKKTNCFYVGTNSGANNLTYMLNEGGKRPYIVRLPIQNTFVGAYYFTSLQEWRTRKIFFSKNPIEMIDVSYKDSVKYSYHIQINGDSIQFTGNQKSDKTLNKKRVHDYLKLFENLYCMGFENSLVTKDSILKHVDMLGTVSVKRKNTPLSTITFYFKPISKTTTKLIDIGDKEYDYNFFFGNDNKNNFMLFSRKTIENMLRSFHEFYEVDNPPSP